MRATLLKPLSAIALALGLCVSQVRTAAAEDFKQIELTDKLVTSFIAAQKEFQPLSSKLAEGSDKPDEALTKELDDIAKKNGFQNFTEFEDVGANITVVLDGLDRKTGTYTDPVEKMKKELEEIKADSTIPAEDKKLAVDDLSEEIKTAQPLKFKGNIDVVKAHIKEIEELIPEEQGESAPADAAAKP